MRHKLNKELVEGNFGHGAIKNKIDLRDRKWKKVAKVSIPFDWTVGYDIEKELSKFLNAPNFRIPAKNQNGSFSCVGQAGAYYEAVQDAYETGVFTEKSGRDIYSQIFYPGGGSSTRDALNHLIKKGVCKESSLTSYQNGKPPKEPFMTQRTDATPQTVAEALKAKGTAYADVGINIDEFAEAIRDNHGLIFTINGANNGTWMSKFPKPPKKIVWGHELYAGKAKTIDGKKYIGVINSWGNGAGEFGWQWIGEEYFTKRFIHSAGVIYDTEIDHLKAQKNLLERILELLQKILSYSQVAPNLINS